MFHIIEPNRTSGGTFTQGYYYPNPYTEPDFCDCHNRCKECGKRKRPLVPYCGTYTTTVRSQR